MIELANKVALVTGGARDIGRAISIRLAGQGAKVAVNWFDNGEDAAETVRLIREKGGSAVAVGWKGTVRHSTATIVQRKGAARRLPLLSEVERPFAA